MKFKLDENLGRSALAALAAAGHDVSSIHLQMLDGASDDRTLHRPNSEAMRSGGDDGTRTHDPLLAKQVL